MKDSDKKISFRIIAGYGAALWALIFALLHIVWAMGWYIGLPADEARKAFQKTWFLAYDLIAAALCIAAVILALSLIKNQRKQQPFARWLVFFGWSATVMLALRGIAGITKIVYLGFAGQNLINGQFLWDLWFCCGAFLFGICTWKTRQAVLKCKL